MKALILNGALADETSAEQVAAAIGTQLSVRGWTFEQIVLHNQKIGNCAGDFFCWVRNPGVCITNDANREIAAAIMQCDLLIWLTPVTFGGYSSALKRMVDHLIQNISPFFTQIDGETHHQRRYAHYPNLLVVGLMEAPDAAAEAIFRNLVKRNALNFYVHTRVCGIVTGNPSDEALAALAGGWLDAVSNGASSPIPTLPPIVADPRAASGPPRRAVLLVGSPRTSKSTSAALGGYLIEQLAARGVETQSFQIYTQINDQTRREALLNALDSADLLLLAFPLYVDSLPAPVIAALELIAARRATGQGSSQRLVAITNCGFPEAKHCDNVLAQCAQFARQAGLSWAGGMALGAGPMLNSAPVASLGPRDRNVRLALDQAAAALASGVSIPAAASALLARPSVPAWLYLFVAEISWRLEARRYGKQWQLRETPYSQAR